MIVVTGSCGFIGKNLVDRLRYMGHEVLGVDPNEKEGIHPTRFSDWWWANSHRVEAVYHLGANADTMEKDWQVLETMNVNFSKIVWYSCYMDNVPLVYASSAAVYGNGEFGFSDCDHLINKLEPMNLYGKSKLEFDKFTLAQKNSPSFWVGLRFFNVYGCGEQHKGRMASMVYHGYKQIHETGYIKLFKFGEQQRDFVYIDDIINVMLWMMKYRPKSGIYNVGTGIARSFTSLAKALFVAMDKPLRIKYINMPDDIKDQYQFFTKACIDKLRDAGYDKSFQPIEQGVLDCVQKFKINEDYYKSMESEFKKW